MYPFPLNRKQNGCLVNVWTKNLRREILPVPNCKPKFQPVSCHILRRATVPSWTSPYRLAQFPGYRGKLFIAIKLNFTYNILRGFHVGVSTSAVSFDRWFSSFVFVIILASSPSSSSVSPSCRISTLIFLRQTMSLGNTVLQLFWCNYSWCVYC